MLADTPEDELTRRAMTGDEDALSLLLARFSAPVLHRIREGIPARMRSMLDAEEVMQVTYLEVFLHCDRFTDRGPGAFLAWLTQLATNNLRDALKELNREKRPNPSRRIQPPSADDSCIALLDLVGYTTTTPSRHAARNESHQVLESAIAQLPDDYQRALRLYDLENRPVAEVATAMGRSKGAVHMLRARALERLREILATGSA